MGIPVFGPIIIVIILVFLYSRWFSSIFYNGGKKLLKPFKLFMFVLLMLLHISILLGILSMNETPQNENLLANTQKVFGILFLLFLVIYWASLINSTFVSLYYKNREYMTLIIFFLYIVAINFISSIIILISKKLPLIFRIVFLIQLYTPLFICFSFIFKTLANEIIANILSTQQRTK